MTRHNDHDPLSVLGDGDLPVTPYPEFAARLRTRLESLCPYRIEQKELS